MTSSTSRYALRPSVRQLLVAFLVHHNPFYLISALCMMAGCYALNSGLAPRTGETGKLLVLLGTLNAYEALVIALGLYLIRRRGQLRDGRTLLLIEAPFLVDLTFLSAEAGSNSLTDGTLLSLAVFVLAVLKVGIVLRVLNGGRLPRRSFALIAMELAALLLAPAAFKRVEHHGLVTAAQFYAAWWIAGMLPVAYDLTRRFDAADVVDAGLRTTIRRLYTALPVISLIAHLGMLHWVYKTPFNLADLSPLMLGAAVVLGRVTRTASGALRGEVVFLRLVLPAAAVLLAMSDPVPFRILLPGRLTLTPASLTVGAAYATYVYCFFLAHALLLLTGGALVAATITFGPSPTQILAWARIVWSQFIGLGDRLIPKTAMHWGIAAMVAAFAFLGIGAGVSLRRGTPDEAVDVGVKT